MRRSPVRPRVGGRGPLTRAGLFPPRARRVLLGPGAVPAVGTLGVGDHRGRGLRGNDRIRSARDASERVLAHFTAVPGSIVHAVHPATRGGTRVSVVDLGTHRGANRPPGRWFLSTFALSVFFRASREGKGTECHDLEPPRSIAHRPNAFPFPSVTACASAAAARACATPPTCEGGARRSRRCASRRTFARRLRPGRGAPRLAPRFAGRHPAPVARAASCSARRPLTGPLSVQEGALCRMLEAAARGERGTMHRLLDGGLDIDALLESVSTGSRVTVLFCSGRSSPMMPMDAT